MRIWQGWVKEPDLVEHLTVDSKTVLGIVGACGDLRPQVIAEVMFPKILEEEEMSRKVIEVDHLMKKLRRSRHRVVRQALEFGLPLSAATPLYLTRRKLKCKTCRNTLASVPCAVCACKAMSAGITLEELDLSADCVERPEPQPTTHFPGSRQKKIVMKYRLQQGQAVFCAADA